MHRINSLRATRGRLTVQTMLRLWLVAVSLLMLQQLAATLFLPRGFLLNCVSNVVQAVLTFSAAFVFFYNGVNTNGRLRLFWILLASTWALRLFVQFGWMYYELALRHEVPNPFAGDIFLFVSNVPALAALILQTQKEPIDWRKSQRVIDFLLLLLWWLYLYLYFVIPWQFVSFDEARYGANYNRLTVLLDVAQILLAGFLWFRSSGRWRWFYSCYWAVAVSLTWNGLIVNQAIDRHEYFSGSYYDIPYTLALASFTLVGLLGSTLPRGLTAELLKGKSLQLVKLGSILLLSLPIITARSVLLHAYPDTISNYRQLLVLAFVFVMTVLVFTREWQLMSELQQAADVLQTASVTDPLTGLRNRRYFSRQIDVDARRALSTYSYRAHSSHGDLILYIVDLDHFKSVNDSFGHDVGDKLLLEVSRRITSVIRETDFLVRWGGDEFLIVSRFADRSDAGNLASRILASVANEGHPLSFPTCEVFQTCSIGWAAFPWYPNNPSEVPLDAVLALADRGAYEAKSSGRNRAIGVLPAKSPTAVFAASAGGHSRKYGVLTECVLGPPPVLGSAAVMSTANSEEFVES